MLAIIPHILAAFMDKRIFRSPYSSVFSDITNYIHACFLYIIVCIDYKDL